MKQQVVVIHGGDYRKSEKKFLTELKRERVEIGDFKRSKPQWKDALQEALGKNFEVFNPQMPTPDMAFYPEWKIWFEKMIPFLKDNVIFVGHSLGAIFLAKYLSENRFPRKVNAVLLLAGPYHTKRAGRDDYAGFGLKNGLGLISKQTGTIILYQSKDDPLVPFSHFSKYRRALPTAETKIFKDKGHFRLQKFPEIVRDIKAL